MTMAIPHPLVENRALVEARIGALMPVHSRTETKGCISPGSSGQGAGRASGAIGPSSSDPFGPGSRHEPGPMGLTPRPPPLVSVGGWNRDQRLSFSPGFSHKPGLKRGLYIPSPLPRTEPLPCFFGRSWLRFVVL